MNTLPFFKGAQKKKTIPTKSRGELLPKVPCTIINNTAKKKVEEKTFDKGRTAIVEADELI